MCGQWVYWGGSSEGCASGGGGVWGKITPPPPPTIRKNLTTNHLPLENHHLIQSDLFTNITKRYDFILTNPPYIDPILDRTETAVKSHEPHLALYGGQSGLELINLIIAEAPIHLLPHGQLWLEHEPEQSAAIQTLGSQHGFLVTTHSDQYNVERYSILVLQ
ncbi:MAG: modification methylase HemK [Candidatus Parcubacteria bacterium]|jgi:methylase of polypeptide subunit release factors